MHGEMKSLDTQWYYAEGQEIKGPFTEKQMVALAEQKTLHEATLVMSQGMTEWCLFNQTDLYRRLQSGNSGDSRSTRSFISSAAEKISEMTGEEGPFSLSMKDMFADVFKKHTRAESERLFIAGTQYTTPEIDEISTDSPRPWLFSRVFLSFLFVYILLFFCLVIFGNANALPGLVLIGSFAVPFSLVIFFFETNVPRNISLFSVVEMFFIGGVAALFVTLLLYSFVHINNLTIFSAIIIGIIEESGKLLIAAWFIRQMNTRYILNGLLIGAVIGAGFASFESAGYALSTFLTNHSDMFFSVIDNRAWSSIGSHTIWTAIATAGLTIVKKQQPFHFELFKQRQFLQFFAVAVILHVLWDMPVFAGSSFKLLLLIGSGWLVVFVLMSSGLRQITRIIRKKQGFR